MQETQCQNVINVFEHNDCFEINTFSTKKTGKIFLILGIIFLVLPQFFGLFFIKSSNDSFFKIGVLMGVMILIGIIFIIIYFFLRKKANYKKRDVFFIKKDNWNIHLNEYLMFNKTKVNKDFIRINAFEQINNFIQNNYYKNVNCQGIVETENNNPYTCKKEKVVL